MIKIIKIFISFILFCVWIYSCYMIGIMVAGGENVGNIIFKIS
jgi:hypothetical protein